MKPAGKASSGVARLGISAESRRARGYQIAAWGAGVIVAGRCVAELRAGDLATSEILVHSAAAVFLLAFAASVGGHASTHPAGRAFARACIVIGLWFVTNRLVFRETMPLGSGAFDAVVALRAIVTAAAVSAFVHLLLVFPDPHPAIRDRRKIVLAIVYAQMGFYLLDDALRVAGATGMAVQTDRLAQISGLVLLCTAVGLAIGRSRADFSPDQQRYRLWLAAGCVVAAVPTALVVVLPVRVLHRAPPMGSLPLLTVLAFPVVAGVAILRDRALEADIELRRSLVTLAGTLLMGGSFLLLAAAAAHGLAASVSPPSLAAAIVGTAIGAVLLLRMGLAGYRRLDRFFDRDRFHDRALLERLASELPTVASPRDLARHVAEILPEALALECATLLVGDSVLRDPLDARVEIAFQPHGLAAHCGDSPRILMRTERPISPGCLPPTTLSWLSERSPGRSP